MKPVPFTKMQSSGNDFVVIDNLNDVIAPDILPDLAKKICASKTGVGSDGLLVLEPDSAYPFFVRFLNPDGSAAFCGNGSLCAALFARRLQLAPAEMNFRSPAGIHRANVTGDAVALAMPPPSDWKLHLAIDGTTGHFVNSGAPHTVIFVDTCLPADVITAGRRIRHHPLFAPDGTNVDFARVLSRSRLKMRTFERGVEHETLSCGSGALAAATAGFFVHTLAPPITCVFPGGELRIDFKVTGGVFTDVTLTNRVVTVFQGTYYYPDPDTRASKNMTGRE